MNFFSTKKTVAKLANDALGARLAGQHILFVGGTAGIGRALALEVLAHGATATVVGRRQPDAALTAAGARFVACDLALLRNAAQLASDLAAAGTLRRLDAVVFTNGILANPKRQESAEGVELDMAVSALSRMAFLQEALKLGLGADASGKNKKPRVYIMGFPGNPSVKLSNPGDLNGERTYDALAQHLNTVIVNEALISWTVDASSHAVDVIGLNPGLIKTEIRDNYLGHGSWLSFVVESLIGLTQQSAETFARNVLVHVLASESVASGEIYGPDGGWLQPNPNLSDELRRKVLEESEQLVQRGLNATLKQ
ncbi:hypothetical protein HK405_008047 [Cladochytrium tenue]|nr:hypothetical protein HK405_008047 [Cladochytrium tenue]